MGKEEGRWLREAATRFVVCCREINPSINRSISQSVNLIFFCSFNNHFFTDSISSHSLISYNQSLIPFPSLSHLLIHSPIHPFIHSPFLFIVRSFHPTHPHPLVCSSNNTHDL